MKKQENRNRIPERYRSRKSARQLIDEFAEFAKGAFYAAIVVAFETETKFVETTDSGQLRKLASLMRHGGQPIGFLFLGKKGKSIDSYMTVFREYVGQDGIDEYVTALCKAFVTKLSDYADAEIDRIQRISRLN